jgi:predicted regulator of Ras-like GTPase activity (Roadblock/LC7/MglB family)
MGMAAPSLIITESDCSRLTVALDQLVREANAKFVFLLDKAGQQIASAGGLEEIDSTALASLTAGNVAATEGVAAIVGEPAFTSLFHEGKHDSLHISVLGERVILLVVFGELSSLGLVRLRVDQLGPGLALIINEIVARAAAPGGDNGPLGEITADDVDALFG